MTKSLDLFCGTPLVAGSVTGIRTFDADNDGHLRGPMYSFPYWHQGENLASCQNRAFGFRYATFGVDYSSAFDFKHSPGTMRCTCGFYAYFSPEGSEYQRYYRIDALVEGYGRVTMGTKGFRCEKAKILALINPLPEAPRRATSFLTVLSTTLWALIPLVLSLIMFALAIRSVWAHEYGTTLKFDAEKWAKVKKRYPEVPIFDSIEDAVREFPLSNNVNSED